MIEWRPTIRGAHVGISLICRPKTKTIRSRCPQDSVMKWILPFFALGALSAQSSTRTSASSSSSIPPPFAFVTFQPQQRKHPQLPRSSCHDRVSSNTKQFELHLFCLICNHEESFGQRRRTRREQPFLLFSSIKRKYRDDNRFYRTSSNRVAAPLSTSISGSSSNDEFSDDDGFVATANNTHNSRDERSASTSNITESDLQHMSMALRHAKLGYGSTFPNPAVGCVLVDTTENRILGSGFHPRAGMPHAEIFALFEACGHVGNGIDAAQSVRVDIGNDTSCRSSDKRPDEASAKLRKRVEELLCDYTCTESDGATELFGNAFRSMNVTAYVTLEPCCHYGKTPPCAVSLKRAGVKRVVVGTRDVNPRVDGGGVQLLQDAGIQVDVLQRRRPQQRRRRQRQQIRGTDGNLNEATMRPLEKEMDTSDKCADLVKYFTKRISPKPPQYEIEMNGPRRSVLRSLAGRLKREGSMTTLDGPARALRKIGPSLFSSLVVDNNQMNDVRDDDDGTTNWTETIQAIELNPSWLESVDIALWEKEIVLLRLGNVVTKKRGAELLGERIANELGAHVVQVVGHTVLINRPDYPPILDLDAMVEK